jgi:hypothetical protein
MLVLGIIAFGLDLSTHQDVRRGAREAARLAAIRQLLTDGATTDGVDCVPAPARLFLSEVSKHLLATLTARGIDPSRFGIHEGRRSRGR